MGTTARDGLASEPWRSSCFSSTPTTKKKSASSPSAAHVCTVRSRCNTLGPSLSSRIASYAPARGEFAKMNPAPAAARIRPPLTVSFLRKSAIRRRSMLTREGFALAEARFGISVLACTAQGRRVRRRRPRCRRAGRSMVDHRARGRRRRARSPERACRTARWWWSGYVSLPRGTR